MEFSRLESPDKTRASKRVRCMICLPALLFLGCAVGAETTDAIPTTSTLEVSDIGFDVVLQGTGSAAIHASVYQSAGGPKGGVNVLAVHDWSGTGQSWKPLAKAMFADPALRRAVRRVIAIDMPGHGDSGFPADLPSRSKFGAMTTSDNVSVLVQSIDALQKLSLAPRVVIALGLGALELQSAQEALLGSGSSLAAHGVTGAVLLAPVPGQEQAWHTALTGAARDELLSRLVTDDELGSYLPIPEPAAPMGGLGYTTRSGQLASGAPTTKAALAAGYFGPEPLLLSAQLLGLLPRPSSSAGAFDARHETSMSIVSFSEDVLVPAADAKGAYEHLTGDAADLLYRPIVANDAVHDMLVSNPTGLIDTLRALPW